MIGTIVTIIIVFLAIIYIGRVIYKSIKGKGCSCNCSCSNKPFCSKPENKEK